MLQAVEACPATIVDRPDADAARGGAVSRVTASLPNGPQVLAWHVGQDIDDLGTTMTLDQALEDLFVRRADKICAVNGLRIDAATRRTLLQQIGESYRLLVGTLKRNTAGDCSPDAHLSRFATFVAPAKPVPVPDGRHTVASVFERWTVQFTDKRATSTLRRNGPSIASLHAFTRGRDLRRVTQDDIEGGAKHRRDHDGIGAGTVNGNDLVAAATVFTWANTKDGGRLRTDDPVTGVKLDLRKRQTRRERTFRHDGIKTTLLAARGVSSGPRGNGPSGPSVEGAGMTSMSLRGTLSTGGRIIRAVWVAPRHRVPCQPDGVGPVLRRDPPGHVVPQEAVLDAKHLQVRLQSLGRQGTEQDQGGALAVGAREPADEVDRGEGARIGAALAVMRPGDRGDAA